MLVMLVGLPGVGKSHLAQAIATRTRAVVVSVDPIEDAMIRSGLPPSFETGVAAYEVGACVAAAQLRNGLAVVVDAANSLEVARDVWRRTAAETGVPLHVIEVVCSDASLHRRRLEDRRRPYVASLELTWAEVVERAGDTEALTGDHLQVDTAGPFDDVLAAVLRHLGA